MIILTIRTDKPESEIGLYNNEEQLSYEEWDAHRALAETLHHKIDLLLSSNKNTWADINGIVAYKGPGSFTGLRIGLSVANALSHSDAIPIVGMDSENWLTEGVKALLAGKNEIQVTPLYGSEANITTPK